MREIEMLAIEEGKSIVTLNVNYLVNINQGLGGF